MKNNKKRIAMIVCYMGKLPWYFDYFAHSCGFNLYIDFYIITDDKSYKKSAPINLHFIYKTLDEINKTATEKLGFETHINNGYKLCDFKPAYGFLFPEADVDKLAAILAAILAKPVHWQDMAQRSQLKAQQQYDKAQALSAYLDLFYCCDKQKQGV